LKGMIVKENTNIIKKMLDGRKSFQDEEMILQTSEGILSFLVSGTPIVAENNEVHSGVIILRFMKDVHRLISRFGSYQASIRFEDIITNDPIMLALVENAKSTASSMSNLLIEGESGTGKELFAQAIHNYGTRRKGPFVPINCGAIPRELISSELFGYAEGAFSGAKKGGSPGKFELASGGTLFLDEIGDMPLEQQTSLLRVIQERMVTRIGGHHAIPVDVRIICATNKDLHAEMEAGNFRRDLYYRMNVINIKIPPLRKRPSDVTLLFNHFLEMSDKSRKKTTQVSDAVYSYLVQYNWPGNVRELQNVVERMVHANPGTYLGLEHLPPEIIKATPPVAAQNLNNVSSRSDENITIDLKKTRTLYRQRMDEVQKRLIIELLERHHGNISQVAKELGISRITLYKKIRK